MVEGALFDTPCMVFQRMCVLCMWSQCVSKCSFHRFCLCFVCRKLSPHLRVESWITGVLLTLFICVILHTMWSGESLQLLCILPFGMLGLSAINMMFLKIMFAVCILVGKVV